MDKRSAAWAQGRAGERAIGPWLMERGHLVAYTADIDDGGAPMFHAAFRRGVVLPDLFVALGSKSRWGEIKTKGKATYYQKTGRYQHGFATSHWEHYRECQNVTGIPVVVIIWELESSSVLIAGIDLLAAHGPRFYEGTAMPGGKPHVFFDRDWFERHTGPTADFDPIVPKAERTLRQRPAPAVRQLSLAFEPETEAKDEI